MYKEKIDALKHLNNIAIITTIAVDYDDKNIPQYCVKDAEDLIKTVDIIGRTKAFRYIAIDNVLGCVERGSDHLKDYQSIKNIYHALSSIAERDNVIIFT